MYKLLIVFGTALTLFGCEQRGIMVEPKSVNESIIEDSKFEVVAKYQRRGSGAGLAIEEVRDLDSGVHYYLFKYTNSGIVGVSEVYNEDGTIKITEVE